jgi:hypothetical protein
MNDGDERAGGDQAATTAATPCSRPRFNMRLIQDDVPFTHK